MYVAPASLAISSSTGEGKTSDPNTADTSSALIWSISAATSDGVGSEKLLGWIAPTTSHPYRCPT